MQKVAVVTGSAKGLGKSIALALAKKGFCIVVHYKSSKKDAMDVLGAVKKLSPNSIAVQANMKDEAETEKAFGEIVSHFGRIDLLVNNVGDFLFKEFGKTSNEEFKNVLESNIYSTLFASRAVLPVMRRQKNGNIINLGSVGAERITLRLKSASYFIAKNAVYALTKVMAHEEAKNGIRINMISPSSMATDIFKNSDFPMGRGAKHEDVVKALLFLISPNAEYINGANIEVAGAFIPGFA
jgi:NAD(P)-dependent dehydrogenase (short-subunit alcohol dehydrogenase family)